VERFSWGLVWRRFRLIVPFVIPIAVRDPCSWCNPTSSAIFIRAHQGVSSFLISLIRDSLSAVRNDQSSVILTSVARKNPYSFAYYYPIYSLNQPRDSGIPHPQGVPNDTLYVIPSAARHLCTRCNFITSRKTSMINPNELTRTSRR